MTSRRHPRPAQALLEFAIIAPLAVLLLVVVADAAVLIREHNSLQTATREAVRTAVHRTSYADAAAAAERTFRTMLQGSRLDPARAQLSALELEGTWGTGGVRLQSSYSARLLLRFPLLPDSLTLRAQENGAVITFVPHGGGGR